MKVCKPSPPCCRNKAACEDGRVRICNTCYSTINQYPDLPEGTLSQEGRWQTRKELVCRIEVLANIASKFSIRIFTSEVQIYPGLFIAVAGCVKLCEDLDCISRKRHIYREGGWHGYIIPSVIPEIRDGNNKISFFCRWMGR